MAFVKIAPKQRYTHSGGTEITVGCYLGEGKNAQDPKAFAKHFVFRFPYLVAKESGFQIVERRMRVFIHEGTGEDTGFLMVVEDLIGGYAATQSKSKAGDEAMTGFSVNIPLDKFAYYTPNECPMAATVVQHTFVDGGILIECPDWLKPNILKMQEDGLMPAPKPTPVVQEVKTKERYPTVRQRAMEATNDVAADVADILPLNRSERRRLASEVAKKLSR